MDLHNKNALMTLLRRKKDRLFKVKCYTCKKEGNATIKDHILYCPYCHGQNVYFTSPIIFDGNQKNGKKDIQKMRNELLKFKFYNKIESALKMIIDSMDNIQFETENKEFNNLSKAISTKAMDVINLIEEFIQKV